MNWKKGTGDVWTVEIGPFSMKIEGKADGRWTWQIYSGDTPNPMATGIARSLGAAKSVAEQFVNRSGLV